jgi:glutathione S-transferase
MLKIWGRISSINVRKVVFTAQELGIPFERLDAGLEYGVNKTPEYLARNPNALVPLIEDDLPAAAGNDPDRFMLWESNVIVRYLCARHSPGQLYPLELPQRFDAERWMDWQQTSLGPAARPPFIQWFRTPAEQRDMGLIERSSAATEALLTIAEQQLAHRPFLTGNRLTMADIPLACEYHRWQALPQPRRQRLNLQRWYDGIAARPAARGVFDFDLS